ncbi:MAG TPA: hypothetical protein VNT79_14380 [Phycisphaerae bacterium]|nr:hypothetical protein [Phycisphaerae bacterium]
MRSRCSRRAATIIEIVMALIILGVAMPTLMNSFVDASSQTVKPTLATIGSFLATERMEEIIGRRYRADDGYGAMTTANFPNESPISGFPAFSRTVTVSYVNSALAGVGGDQGYKLVRVRVTWSGGAVAIERIFADF